ncbi:MAG: class I SAM-dependent methyltransferase [Elusimicrobia bacterium]|nr:class I SAM-dependent methyltransferase [Elusimicrobiota bacterium]
MANFKAWKAYMLYLIDKLVDEHELTGPFLDAGCGTGEVSIHFAQKGWKGTAVDFSEDVAAATARQLSQFPNVTVRHGDLFQIDLPPAATVFLMDVVEHVKEDEEFIRQIARHVEPGGHVVITVPVNPTEWRWDDDFYGHYRRYRRSDFRVMLERSGFKVVSEWDCSFPLFWLMRRLYTLLFPRPEMGVSTPEERTKISTRQSAWEYSRLSHWIDAIFSATRLYLVHYPFRKRQWGCELLLVARREPSN